MNEPTTVTVATTVLELSEITETVLADYSVS